MSMLTGYMLRYTGVKTLGLCHSVQTCSKTLMDAIGMSDRLEMCIRDRFTACPT